MNPQVQFFLCNGKSFYGTLPLRSSIFVNFAYKQMADLFFYKPLAVISDAMETKFRRLKLFWSE